MRRIMPWVERLKQKKKVLLWFERGLWLAFVVCMIPLAESVFLSPLLTVQAAETLQVSKHSVAPNKESASPNRSSTRGADFSQDPLKTQVTPARNGNQHQAHTISWQQPDLSQWSLNRKRSFLRWLAGSPEPVAVLEFVTTGSQVAVFSEESERAMTLGASYLDGQTTISADVENIALSSHRDGPFRQLQTVSVGDVIALHTPAGSRRFVVRQTAIVQPDNVSVLSDNGENRLTLVTCYPFYFLGPAPQRFIVEAVFAETV